MAPRGCQGSALGLAGHGVLLSPAGMKARGSLHASPVPWASGRDVLRASSASCGPAATSSRGQAASFTPLTLPCPAGAQPAAVRAQDRFPWQKQTSSQRPAGAVNLPVTLPDSPETFGCLCFSPTVTACHSLPSGKLPRALRKTDGGGTLCAPRGRAPSQAQKNNAAGALQLPRSPQQAQAQPNTSQL